MKSKNSILSAVFFVLLSFQANAGLVCPPDVWLNCGAEIWDLNQYGHAYFSHNGYQYDAGTPEVSYHTTACETGKIYRTWRYEDSYWNWHECTQTIYISGGHFSYHNIYWPHNDLQLYGCNVNTHPDHLPYGYGRPTFDYMTCSMVGSSYKDQVFNFGPDCKKILRKWTVLDWCNYGNGYSNPGVWTYTQTIKVSNTEQPNLTCTPEVIKNAQTCYGSYVNLPSVTANGNSCYGGYDVVHDSPYADTTGNIASGFYPVGTTRVNYTIKYACGSEMYCHTDVIVKDKGPVPYCLATLNVVLMPVDSDNDGQVDDGMVEVWAKDLDYGSYHPCNNHALQYSFSSDVTNTFITFTCEEAGYNDVQLWITDYYGNQSWCSVQVIVQNNAANIPDCQEEVGNKVVNGTVTNEKSEPLEQVYINLKSKGYFTPTTIADTTYEEVIIDSFYNATGTLLYLFDYRETITYSEVNAFKIAGSNLDILSDDNGEFGTDDIDLSRQYTMTAFKLGDMTKIDETDIALLDAYLKEQRALTNPYSFIAADINEDGILNTIDLSLLKALYSGEEDEWPMERQWVFYNESDLAQMSSNPLSDEMQQKITLKEGEVLGEHFSFMGILKGDLSSLESAKSNGFNLNSRSVEKEKHELKIYPNPYVDVININNPGGKEINISVYNTDGKTYYNASTKSESIQVYDSKDWPSGTYIISIKSQGETTTEKVIKI